MIKAIDHINIVVSDLERSVKFYTQVLGLSGTYSGIAVFIAVAFDAVTDPAVGSWSDGFRHRFGRRNRDRYQRLDDRRRRGWRHRR